MTKVRSQFVDTAPIVMEDYFRPGFKTKPAVYVGSQTSRFIRQNPQEQAWEGFYLGAARPNDVVVVRDIDPAYLSYWTSLMGKHNIINLAGEDPGEFLTNIILNKQEIIDEIKQSMGKEATLMVFFPTELEKKLAEKLQIPLHGSHGISDRYGVKSGIRILAKKAGVPMPPGYICKTLSEIGNAIWNLQGTFNTIILKHDASFSGYFSKRVNKKDFSLFPEYADEISGGKFREGKDVIVVEGWLKSKASVCVHIEILEGNEPIICSAWQQIMDKDGISYMGGGPLILSSYALSSLLFYSKSLALALKETGAVGSFGPDFVITANDQKPNSDSAVLIELNARVPYTAVPLEIVKDVRGRIGSGFLAKHINIRPKTTFSMIAEVLKKKKLLIEEKSVHARGIVPYNVGLLQWGIFDGVLMADSWEEVKIISDAVSSLFANDKYN